MLNVNCAGFWGQGQVNEDVVGHAAGAAWVIDGATGLGASLLDAPSDAAWFAERADLHFRRILVDRPDMDMGDLLATVMAACRDDLENEAARPADGPHEHPSAAIAIVRLVADGVELATLGDCRIAHRKADGAAHLFGTTALDAIEGRTIAWAATLLFERPEMSPDELKDALLPRLRENRRLMNVEGGYWVLGTDPRAAAHADRTVLPHRPGASFALASDGFLRLVELFRVADPTDLLAIASTADLDTWMARLRAIEAEPGSMLRHPRVKPSDDASFINVQFDAEG